MRLHQTAGDVEGGEVVAQGFGAADEFDAAVFSQKQLRASELAVVVESHGVAVCARVVDDDAVADVDLGQLAVDGEFVVVLAERAGDVVDMVTEGVFLADDGDVVVSAVDGGAHEVRHAGVESDVVLVRLLFMQRRRDEPAVGTRDIAARFGLDGESRKACRLDDLLVERFDAAGDALYVDGFFFGAVGDAEAAAEVDEFE